MKPIELKKGIYWVGAIDWDLRNFHGYLTQKGSTYNAYLIIDEKVTLVDAVKHCFFDEMISRISEIVDPSKIDYVVSNHVEMDHSGALPDLMKVCPKATIITSPNGEKGLKQHYQSDWKYQIVNTGDTLSIGKRTLSFLLMQMVHWPDSMATYIADEKLLFPNDAFGQHIASFKRFDDETGWDIALEEAAKYYANIVLPYSKQVCKVLDAVEPLGFDMIAPSHGIVWRKYCKEIIAATRKWANNEPDGGAVVVYDTMWKSTEKMARAIYEAFDSQGISCRMMNLQTNHISDILMKLLSARYICVGSPTLNNSMLPSVAAFLTYLKGLAPQNRTALAFGSYGWGGQSIGQVEEMLSGCGFDMMESIKAQYIPSEETLSEIKEKLKGVLPCQT